MGVAVTPETNPPYSFAADLLSKFHTSPDWIQALWLIAVPALIFGLAFLLKEMVLALARRSRPDPGDLIYSIHRDAEGGFRLVQHGDGDAAGLWRKAVAGPRGAELGP